MTTPAVAPAPDGGAPPAAPEGGTPPVQTPVAAVPAAPAGEGAGGAPPGDGSAPPANWFATPSETWRQDLVEVAGYEGDDATARLGQLERVLDPSALAKNYFNAQDKIRNGEISNGLPENPTDEQMGAWREANGVPATVEDYAPELAEGLVLGDDDTRILAEVFKVFHAGNVSNTVAGAAVNAMLTAREAEVHLMQQQDGVDLQQTAQLLKDAWQHDYTANVNLVTNLLEGLPEASRDDFKNARMADGKGMLNSPEVMVFLADLARKVNPGGTVVPNSDNPIQSIKDEIATLEARMSEDDWHKDTDANNRLEALYEAEEQMEMRQ